MKQRLCILLAGLLCLGLNIGNRKTEKPAAADGEAVTAYLDVSASAGNDGNFIYTEGNIKYIEFTPTAAALRAASDLSLIHIFYIARHGRLSHPVSLAQKQPDELLLCFYLTALHETDRCV